MKTSSDTEPRFAGRGGPMRAIARIAVLLVLVAIVVPAGVQAQSLNELRAQGIVGERYDGYAVVRETPAPAGVAAFVERVNAQRQEIYERRAAEQGVSPGQVGRVYASQLLREVPPGTWFLDEAGRWVRK